MFQAAREHPIVAALVLLPGVMYLASMFCPVDGDWSDSQRGWMAGWACLCFSSQCVWEMMTHPAAWSGPFEGALAFFAGTLANLSFVVVSSLAWKLRQRPATVALLHLGSFTAALVIPPLLALWPIFGTAPGWPALWSLSLTEVYNEWQIGYWLWTASFGCAMLVWAGLWRRQWRASTIH